MLPVNQVPLSLNEMKRSPLASSRIPDSPPKPGKREVSTSPLRYSSAPNRTRARSPGSNAGIGRAFTSIETGAATENSSGATGFAGGCVASCARAMSDIAIVENPAAVDVRKRRRERLRCLSRLMARRQSLSAMGHLVALRMQPAPGAGPGGRSAAGFAEQLGQLFGDRAAEFLGIHDGDRAAIVARDIVTDADRDQLDRRAGLDFLDDMAQVPLEIIAGIDRQRRIVDRRTVGNHHQDLALLGAAQKPLMRPVQRLPVDVLLEQALAHHQAQILACPPPRRVGGFVDDVPEIVEPAGIGRLAGGKPGFPGLSALPGAGGETEDFHLDAAALER